MKQSLKRSFFYGISHSLGRGSRRTSARGQARRSGPATRSQRGGPSPPRRAPTARSAQNPPTARRGRSPVFTPRGCETGSLFAAVQTASQAFSSRLWSHARVVWHQAAVGQIRPVLSHLGVECRRAGRVHLHVLRVARPLDVRPKAAAAREVDGGVHAEPRLLRHLVSQPSVTTNSMTD